MGGTRDELMTLSDQVQTFADLEFIFKGFLQCRVPVIAAIQGHASGGGLVFGLYADIVLMAEESLYSAVFTKYGFTPGLGATFIIGEKFGNALATEMMMTAGTYRGTDLMQRGASVIFKPQAQVFAEALVTARALADKPAYTLRTLKQTLARRKLEQLPAILAEELRMHAETFGNPEVKRRIAQFIRIEESEGAPTTPTVPAPATPSAVSDPPSSNGRVRLKSLVPSKTLTPSLQAISLEKTELTQVRLEQIEDKAVVVPAGSFADEEVRGTLLRACARHFILKMARLVLRRAFAIWDWTPSPALSLFMASIARSVCISMHPSFTIMSTWML